MNINTIDISGLIRARSLINSVRNLGFVVSGMSLLLAFASLWYLVPVIAFWVANFCLARGGSVVSRVVAALLLVTTLGVAAEMEISHRANVVRVEQWIVTEDLSSFQAELIRSSAQRNRYFVWAAFALGGCYFVALMLTIMYPRNVESLYDESGWRARLVDLRARYLRLTFLAPAVRSFATGIVILLFPLSLMVLYGMAGILPDWTKDVTRWLEGREWMFFLTLPFVVLSTLLIYRAKRLATPSMHTVRARDPRSPVLLLRSFSDDTTPLSRTSNPHSWMRGQIFRNAWTLEETIERSLSRYGPVIAIGRPGETLPPAGAAREYVSNSRWKTRVAEHILSARLVVVILGETEGLALEYQMLLNFDALTKLVLVLPPTRANVSAQRWKQFTDVASPSLQSITESGLDRAMTLFFPDRDTVGIVTGHRRNDEDCYQLALERTIAGLKEDRAAFAGPSPKARDQVHAN